MRIPCNSLSSPIPRTMAVNLNMKGKAKSSFPNTLTGVKTESVHKVKSKVEGEKKRLIMTNLLLLSLDSSLLWEQKLIAFLVFRHSAQTQSSRTTVRSRSALFRLIVAMAPSLNSNDVPPSTTMQASQQRDLTHTLRETQWVRFDAVKCDDGEHRTS